MKDTDHFHAEVDRLDTGIPEVPDLYRIRAAGRRQRRRRTAGAVAGGALALAVVVPTALLAAGGTDIDGDDRQAADAAPAPASPVGSADATFGAGMRAAVAGSLPDAREHAGQERLGDRWVWRDSVNLDWEVADPPRWESLFAWSQQYDVDGASLSVVATREPENPTVDAAAAGYCRDGLYVVEKSCTAERVDDRVVVVHEGTQVRGSDPDSWGIDIDVYGAEGDERYGSLTRIGAVTTGDTWSDARAQLPTTDDLVALALDTRLVLPEPERYPRQFPPNRPQG